MLKSHKDVWMAQILQKELSMFHKKAWVNSSDHGSDSFSASMTITSQKTKFPLVKSHQVYFRLIHLIKLNIQKKNLNSNSYFQLLWI